MRIKGFLLSCVTAALLIQLSTTGLVKKVIRHRREALMPKRTQENLTLPHPDQPVVFNHVYNINVPSTSLCSVDLDSPGGTEPKHKSSPMDMQSTEHMEHTVDGDNQIVFTHRINIPKQACSCDNQLPDIKDILNRLEMLESELSSLREQCGSGAGCCGAQVTGRSTRFATMVNLSVNRKAQMVVFYITVIGFPKKAKVQSRVSLENFAFSGYFPAGDPAVP